MSHQGRALAAFGAILIIAFIAQGSAQQAPKGKDTSKFDKAQQQEVQALVRLVDQAAAGQPVPSDIPVTFQDDYLKARDGRTYVPFMLTIDAAKVTSPSMAIYLRVARKGTPPPPAADAKDKKAARPEYAFEDVYFLTLPPPPAGQPFRVSRAFAVPGGDYDVYLALRDRPAAGAKPTAAAPAATTVFSKALAVPDYGTGDLATSSIIFADQVTELQTPFSAQEQAEHPFTFGTTQIVPAADMTFSKKENLSILFLVYNTALDANKKPDVTVDYDFSRTLPDGTEKRFNSTSPQVFNASTLPPQFDPALGHQLVAGQEIPLASFPEGTYRLEIKITDNLAKKTLTRTEDFTVTAG